VSKWGVRLSFEAESDIAHILAYTRETFGEAQARIYQETLIDALMDLSHGPEPAGSRARDDISPGLRSLHVARKDRKGRHFILYRPSDDFKIDILRLLHDSMDLARHLPPKS
jgi:toxin ParE1/3/4